MIDAVRLTFAALREAGPADVGELRVRAVEGGPPQLRLGLDHEGRPHLLVEAHTGEIAEPGIVAISIRERDLQIDDAVRRHVDIACEVVELSEVFDHFVAAVLERSAERVDDVVDVVWEVLDRWRSFFAAMGAPPARETLTAVVGELLLLRDVARVDASDVLSAWVGPRGGRHDLRRGLSAVEVKTTRSHTSRVVTIHGDDQLLPPEGGTLHLHLIRLEEVAGLGVCVSDLVDELVGLGVPRVDLFDALADAGVPLAAFPAVAGIRFDVRERLSFIVDEQMPRIVPETFAAGRRPVGVLDITYRIDLDQIGDRALDREAFDLLVSQLTSGGGVA